MPNCAHFQVHTYKFEDLNANNLYVYKCGPWTLQSDLQAIRNVAKETYPNHFIIIQSGCFWQVFDEDARWASKHFGWRQVATFNRSPSCKTALKDTHFENELRRINKNYILIEKVKIQSTPKYFGITYTYNPTKGSSTAMASTI